MNKKSLLLLLLTTSIWWDVLALFAGGPGMEPQEDPRPSLLDQQILEHQYELNKKNPKKDEILFQNFYKKSSEIEKKQPTLKE